MQNISHNYFEANLRLLPSIWFQNSTPMTQVVILWVGGKFSSIGQFNWRGLEEKNGFNGFTLYSSSSLPLLSIRINIMSNYILLGLEVITKSTLEENLGILLTKFWLT